MELKPTITAPSTHWKQEQIAMVTLWGDAISGYYCPKFRKKFATRNNKIPNLFPTHIIL